MNNKEIQEKLRSSNIFNSSVSTLPFHNTAPDLKELNKNTSDRIKNIIEYKIKNPEIPISGLILCDAGAGKTHMLSRIYREIKNLYDNTFFVNIRAFMNPNSVFQDLLSDLIVNLNHKNDNNNQSEKSPFDIITQNFIAKIKKNIINDKNQTLDFTFNTFVQKLFSKLLDKNQKNQVSTLKLICKTIPEIDKKFANCIASYVNSESVQDSDFRKSQIIEWLKSGLSESDCENLSLPLRDVSSMDNYECENEASKFLLSLGFVLRYSESNIVLCFDQLDGMYERDLINSWGNILNLLINNVPCVVPLVFARPDTWETRFSKYLDESVKQRLSANIMPMLGCTIEQANSLIKLRIENYFSENESIEIYNNLINRLQGKILNGYSPRRVIETANNEIWHNWKIIEESLQKQIERNFLKKCRLINKSQDFFPPSEKDILLALETWLNSQDDFKLSCSGNKHPRLSGYFKKNFEIVIVTTTSKYAPYNISLIDRCIKYLSKIENEILKNEKRCCFISETSIITATSKVTQEKLNNFEKLGGFKILLNKESRVYIYALAELIKDINSKKISLYKNESEIKYAELNDLTQYLKNFNLIDGMLNYLKTPSNTNSQITNIILKLCYASPMNVISGNFALNKLLEQNIKISRENLIILLRFDRNFYITETKDDFQILLSKNAITKK